MAMKSVKSLVLPSTLSQYRMTMMTIVTMMTMVPSSLSQYKIVRHNPFASLTPTLAEYTVEGEDGEVLNLSCPGETRIVITAASYQPANNSSNCALASPLLQVKLGSSSTSSLRVKIEVFALPGADVLPAQALLFSGSVTSLLVLLHLVVHLHLLPNLRPLSLPDQGGEGVVPLQTRGLQICGYLSVRSRSPALPFLSRGIGTRFTINI